jgi:myo-inositol 2-dehydrogenase / D-chiro-inositol 1-dehydrogenase
MIQSIAAQLGRRRFLKQAGALATAAALARPFSIRAQESVKKLRMGIVGCGRRGKVVSEMAQQDGRFEVVALADVFQDQVDKLGEEIQVPAGRRYTGLKSCERLLDAGGLDILAVISPPYFHPEQVEAAVEAGVHVWLAKPIAVDAPGVARVAAAAKKATAKKKCVLVDFQTRAYPHFHEAARRVAAGALGKLGFGEIEGSCPGHRLREPQTGPEGRLRNWLQWKDLCGESVVEYSIHAIDVASLMMGRPPKSATGICRRNLLDHLAEPRPGDVKDLMLVEYDYGEGLVVQLRAKRFDQYRTQSGEAIELNLFGTQGRLFASYTGEVQIIGKEPFNGDAFLGEKLRAIYRDGILRNFATFHKNIGEGNCANETVAASVQSHYLALLAREAGYRGGAKVTWEEVTGSKEKLEYDPGGLPV